MTLSLFFGNCTLVSVLIPCFLDGAQCTSKISMWIVLCLSKINWLLLKLHIKTVKKPGKVRKSSSQWCHVRLCIKYRFIMSYNIISYFTSHTCIYSVISFLSEFINFYISFRFHILNLADAISLGEIHCLIVRCCSDWSFALYMPTLLIPHAQFATGIFIPWPFLLLLCTDVCGITKYMH